jgi:DNA-cytosine methyltransferase
MIVLSLFDGMSCGQLALKKLGVEPDLYIASEVDESAINVANKNFPRTKQIGDVTKVDGKSLPKVDVLIGGSPCQGFSFAGNQLNFQHPESKLFFEYARLLEECRPRFFLLENVVMKKEYEEVISGILGVKPILINSNLLSAQNRKRLYWTNIEGVEQPENKNIGWGTVRQSGERQHKHFYTHKAMQWLANESIKKGRPLTIHRNDEKMQMLEANHHKKYSSQRFFAVADDDPGLDQAKFPVYGVKNTNPGELNIRLNNGTLVATKDGRDHEITRRGDLPSGTFALRYVTPTECERLQTVPEGYTACVSDTQRYRMLGNGWTVDVVKHILSYMPR